MLYINARGEFPKYAGDVQLVSPSWNIGDPLPEGWSEVQQTEPPQLEEGQTIASSSAELTDSGYVQTYQIREMTAEEIEQINAPASAKEKLIALGFTELEIKAIARGILA